MCVGVGVCVCVGVGVVYECAGVRGHREEMQCDCWTNRKFHSPSMSIVTGPRRTGGDADQMRSSAAFNFELSGGRDGPAHRRADAGRQTTTQPRSTKQNKTKRNEASKRREQTCEL